ncbi:MAG: hypothetical protein QOJ40_1404, partial [Verrucomicrobiota bacterium]
MKNMRAWNESRDDLPNSALKDAAGDLP